MSDQFYHDRRERYISVAIRGIDSKAAHIRTDAHSIVSYAETLISMKQESDEMRGSIAAARMALTEALLAVRVAEQEYDRAFMKGNVHVFAAAE
jgi:hypothetical protein